jgi:proteasome lid subunit RPN8/RPN11
MIVTRAFGLLPFVNGSKTPRTLVKMADDSDFSVLASLAAEDQVWGWAHSHIDCEPVPSAIDIQYHQFSFNMVIFSCETMLFGIYTAKEIACLAGE